MLPLDDEAPGAANAGSPEELPIDPHYTPLPAHDQALRFVLVQAAKAAQVAASVAIAEHGCWLEANVERFLPFVVAACLDRMPDLIMAKLASGAA